MHGQVSPKIDIFSFGVLVLEIVTRRSNCSSDDHSVVNLLSDVSAQARFTHFASPLQIRINLLLDDLVTGLGSLDKRVDIADAGSIVGWVQSKPSAAMHPRRSALRPSGP